MIDGESLYIIAYPINMVIWGGMSVFLGVEVIDELSMSIATIVFGLLLVSAGMKFWYDNKNDIKSLQNPTN